MRHEQNMLYYKQITAPNTCFSLFIDWWCVTDPVRRQAVQQQLSSWHLSCAELVLQSLDLYAGQPSVLISTHLCVEQTQTPAALWEGRETSSHSVQGNPTVSHRRGAMDGVMGRLQHRCGCSCSVLHSGQCQGHVCVCSRGEPLEAV